MSKIDPLTYISQVLDEAEQEQIRQFVDNEQMRESVRKAILCGLYHQGVIKKNKRPDIEKNFAISLFANNPGMTDEKVGAEIRACWEGIKALERAFDDMALLKTVEETEEKTNPAR